MLHNLQVSNNSLGVHLNNGDLAQFNLIVGDNGSGKSLALRSIDNEVRLQPQSVPVARLIEQKTSIECELISDYSSNEAIRGDFLGTEKESITKLLRAFYSEFDSMSERDDILVIKQRTSHDLLGLFELGAGFSIALDIALRVSSCHDGIVLIDNIEHNISEKNLERLLQFIVDSAKANNNQVFITTHSSKVNSVFMKCVNNDSDVDGVVIRLGKSVKKSNLRERIATVFTQKEWFSYSLLLNNP